MATHLQLAQDVDVSELRDAGTYNFFARAAMGIDAARSAFADGE